MKIKIITIVLPLAFLTGCFDEVEQKSITKPITTTTAEVCDAECEQDKHEHFHSGTPFDTTDGKGF